MIDTDKYEGHTPAPWEIYGERICAQDACSLGNVGGDIATVIDEVNAQLIADAPLLLEEVKRKTALADALWGFIEANIPHLIHQATDVWNNHNEEAIE